MKIPPLKHYAKQKLKQREAAQYKREMGSKKLFAGQDLAKAVFDGKPQETIRAMAKARQLPKSELQAYIREQSLLFNQIITEARSLLIDKGIEAIQSIDMKTVHPNSRALVGAILIDKALKASEGLKEFATIDATPQENLLAFLKQHNIPFDQLTHIIQTGQPPEHLPLDLFRRLQDILRQRSHSLEQGPRTIDIPTERTQNPAQPAPFSIKMKKPWKSLDKKRSS